MEPEKLIYPALVVYILIGVLVVVEHHFFKGFPELIRRGMGISTVLGLTLIPALAGIVDIWSWLFITLAFIVAGAILSFLVVREMLKESTRRMEKLSERLIPGDRPYER